MEENIALIDEVHYHLSREDAEAKAREYLAAIGLERVAKRRKNECSAIELFYVMIIRAFMCESRRVYVVFPFVITGNVLRIAEVIEAIQKLPAQKEIVFVDMEANAHHYKDCGCSMIK